MTLFDLQDRTNNNKSLLSRLSIEASFLVEMLLNEKKHTVVKPNTFRNFARNNKKKKKISKIMISRKTAYKSTFPKRHYCIIYIVNISQWINIAAFLYRRRYLRLLVFTAAASLTRGIIENRSVVFRVGATVKQISSR